MTRDEAIKIINKLLDGLHKLKKIGVGEEYQVRMSPLYCDALIEALELITEGMEE